MKNIRRVASRLSHGSKHEDAGITSIEYGLVATAIALLVIAGVGSLGPKILALFRGDRDVSVLLRQLFANSPS